MPIYTKQGDAGKTSLSSGEKVSKSDIRVEAYGTTDELNSYIGLLRAELQPHFAHWAEIDERLNQLQVEIFNLGSHLSTKNHEKAKPLALNPQISRSLENDIDKWTSQLPELRNFLLPSGCKLAALAHVVRTVCRRAERAVVYLQESEGINFSPEVIILLNRMSDYFFMLSRYFNIQTRTKEVTWKPN